MCLYDTSAKIVKGCYENSASTVAEKISFAIPAPELFLRKFFLMELQRRNKNLYWILFFVSTLLLILAIAWHWPWLTLILPFMFTFFVLALDLI